MEPSYSASFPLTSIVIPVFNQAPYTKNCLAALAKHYDRRAPFEVIVFDNGSTDDTAAVLEEAGRNAPFPLTVQRSAQNLGFSPACNQGAAQARGDALVFLNNDTEPEEGWLVQLLSVRLSWPEAGIVGPKLLYPDTRTVNSCGYAVNLQLGGFYMIYHEASEGFIGACKEREHTALLGACVLISRKLFQEVGGFSEYGLEDIDLCLKVRERGYGVVYAPLSVVLHHGSVTIRRSPQGSIPAMTAKEFFARWEGTTSVYNDRDLYEQDGFRMQVKAGAPDLTPILDTVRPLIDRALTLPNSEERATVIDQLLALWPHAPELLRARLARAEAAQDFPRALQAALILRCMEPGNWHCHQVVARLQSLCGASEDAKSSLQRIAFLPGVSPDQFAAIVRESV